MKLKGRRIDEFGNVIFTQYGLSDLILNGEPISGLYVEDSEIAIKFNQMCKKFDQYDQVLQIYKKPEITLEEFDKTNQSNWLIPKEYLDLNVLEYLYSKCSTVEEITRVQKEWKLFEERDMEPVLRTLIYMVDNFRERNILWGVGRGSSVASYCLFLIGIHRVNSLKFNLDPTEFLK